MERHERIRRVCEKLVRGDINRIAVRANVSREWVSRVLHGHVVSEPVLRSAEALLAERKQQRVN